MMRRIFAACLQLIPLAFVCLPVAGGAVIAEAMANAE